MTPGRTRHALYLLLAVVALRAATLFVPIFIHDEACIAVQAQTLVHGGHLYTDSADRKPPLVPYLYAAAFAVTGSSDMIAVHVLAILVVWLTALVLWKEAGLLAAWLWLGASTSFLSIDVMGANFELFMLLPSTAAMCIARRRDLASAFAAGVLIALAALCKQTALVMLLPVAFRLGRDLSARGLVRVVVMGVGLVAMLGAAALYLGPRELWFWTVAGNVGYLSIDGIVQHVIPRFFAMTAAYGAATLGIWIPVALAWPSLRPKGEAVPREEAWPSLRLKGEAVPREEAWPRRTQALDWWVWLGANVVAVAAGLRFFGHYYFHLMPAACAIAASQLPFVSTRLRNGVFAYTALAATVFALLGFWARAIHHMPDYRVLAAEIDRRTTPDETVAIWGNYPEILWAADRRSSVRFVHSNFLTGYSSGRPSGRETAPLATPGAWEMLFADLKAHPPKLFLDTAPSGMRDYGQYPLSDFPVLQKYVDEHFRRAGTVDGVDFYESVNR